jgi:hypothetical protein
MGHMSVSSVYNRNSLFCYNNKTTCYTKVKTNKNFLHYDKFRIAIM